MFQKIINYLKQYIQNFYHNEQTDTTLVSFQGIPFDENRISLNIGISIFNKSWVDTNTLSTLYKWIFNTYNINANIELCSPDILANINNDTYDIIILIMGDTDTTFPKSQAEKRLNNVKLMLNEIINIQECITINDVIPYANLIIRCQREYDINNEEFINNKFSLNYISDGERIRLIEAQAKNQHYEYQYNQIISMLNQEAEIGVNHIVVPYFYQHSFVKGYKENGLCSQITLCLLEQTYNRLINEGFHIYCIKDKVKNKIHNELDLLITLYPLNPNDTFQQHKLFKPNNHDDLNNFYNKYCCKP